MAAEEHVLELVSNKRKVELEPDLEAYPESGPNKKTNKKPTKRKPFKPDYPYVGIFIQCHGKFDPRYKEAICSPRGVTLKKQSRGGYGCVTYGYERHQYDGDTYGIAQKLAFGTYEMRKHSEYETMIAKGFKGVDGIHTEHICVAGETCMSSPADVEACWRVTTYVPFGQLNDPPSWNLKSAFQIYVDDKRHINLWKCTDEEFKTFLRIEPGNEHDLKIQSDLLLAIRTRLIETGHLFAIIEILNRQGYSKFNIADYACHGLRVKNELMRPSEVERGKTSKGTPWNYGGRKRKTKRKRRFSNGLSHRRR